MSINWKNLCYHMSHSSFANEAEIEKGFGSYLDMIFGWHEFEGRLRHQVPVQVGHEVKKADIVLYHDGSPFVIEMKGPGIVPQEPEMNQLKSYMKILGSEYGMIANDKRMWLYYSAFNQSKIAEFACIPFDPESADGAAFASIMTYGDHSLEKMGEFRKKKQQESAEKKKAEELAKLLCDPVIGRQILLKALLGCEDVASLYSAKSITLAVGEVRIEKETKDPPHVVIGPIFPHVVPPHEPPKGFTGFQKKGLPVGTVVVFKGDPSLTATVAGDKSLMYEGKIYTISGLAKHLYTKIGKLTQSGAYHGAVHFLYNGTLLLHLPDKQ